MGVRLRAPLQRDRGLHPLPAAQDRSSLRRRLAGDGSRRRVSPAKGWGPLSRLLLSHLSIRLRVTLVFTAVMALVLGAIGLFVFVRFRAELDSTINAGLRSRAADVVALVREADSGLGERRGGNLVGRTESFAEVLEADGSVLDSSAAVGDEVLLRPEELAAALRELVLVSRCLLPGREESSRLLATPVMARGRRRVVVVGTSTEARDESLTD